MNHSCKAYGAYLLLLLFAGAVSLSACSRREKTEVEVEVRSIGLDNASHAPVVVLEDHDRKVALPIWIGPAEAQSIAMQMQGINPPRPMTHDLIKTMLDRAGVELRKVVIQDLKDSTYYARIYLRAGKSDLEIDSRPSDAIALAVRFHSPIFVATALMKGDTTIDLQHESPGASTVRFSGLTVQNLTDDLAEYFSLPPGCASSMEPARCSTLSRAFSRRPKRSGGRATNITFRVCASSTRWTAWGRIFIAPSTRSSTG